MTSLFLVLVFCHSAEARRSHNRVGLEVTPVVGYERTQKLLPEVRTTQRLIYGARIVWGVPIVAAEAEYLRAIDTETVSGISVEDETDRAKIGVRSRLGLGQFVLFVLRAGAQATRNIHYETVGTTTTMTEEAIRYKPYAGAGFTMKLGRFFYANADLVAVFRDFPNNYSQNDYQLSAGFTVRFP